MLGWDVTRHEVCVYWWWWWRRRSGSIQGYEVVRFSFTGELYASDELPGNGSQLSKEKTWTLRLWPQGPFSNSNSDFPQNVEEEMRSSLEGVRVGRLGGGGERRMNESTWVRHPTLLTFSFISLHADEIQNEQCSVEMQKAIMRPSECTDATYDGWVWDLESPPVKHRLFHLLNRPSPFSHMSLLSKPYQFPCWKWADICNLLAI